MESRGPADAFLTCACGRRHWGLLGAAGLLAWRRPAGGGGSVHGVSAGGGAAGGEPTEPEVMLQLRAGWSHHGGTWALPGGALQPGETPLEAACREACEETGMHASGLTPRHLTALRHPNWAYHTVLAEVTGDIGPELMNDETAALEWVASSAVGERELHPAFRESWTELARLLARPVVVVDAANVVGSRPDGWWKDRAGAAERLLAHVAGRSGWDGASLGYAAETSWPDVHVVLEGAAKAAADPEVGGPGHSGPATPPPAAPSPATPPRLTVHRAPGEGDETILEVAVGLAEEGADVVVATADRGLIHWLEAAGVRTTGPRAVWGGDSRADRTQGGGALGAGAHGSRGQGTGSQSAGARGEGSRGGRGRRRRPPEGSSDG